MDLIERQAAIDAIESHIRTAEEPYQLTQVDKVLNHAFEVSASCIYNAPSAQPEHKKGRWINHRNDNGHNIADCDKCGEAMQWFDDDIKPNYCPNCGVDMRGEAGDEAVQAEV